MLAISLAILVVACNSGEERTVEVRVAEAYESCMEAAGYPARNTEFIIEDNQYVSVEGSHVGQGAAAPDSANGRCIKTALDSEGVDYQLP